jgi:hypothetical protein
MPWVGAVVALVAAAATAYNTDQTAKHQDQNAAAGIRHQNAIQDEANRRILSTIADARKSTSDDERKAANDEYLTTLRAKMGQANQGLAARGISQQFDQLAQGEAANNADFGTNIASLMARMDAPLNQRRGEAASYGNLGMDLTRLNQNIGGEDFLTRLRQASIQRNPWIDLAASAANGYAANYGGGNGNTGKPGSKMAGGGTGS